MLRGALAFTGDGDDVADGQVAAGKDLDDQIDVLAGRGDGVVAIAPGGVVDAGPEVAKITGRADLPAGAVGGREVVVQGRASEDDVVAANALLDPTATQ